MHTVCIQKLCQCKGKQMLNNQGHLVIFQVRCTVMDDWPAVECMELFDATYCMLKCFSFIISSLFPYCVWDQGPHLWSRLEITFLCVWLFLLNHYLVQVSMYAAGLQSPLPACDLIFQKHFPLLVHRCTWLKKLICADIKWGQISRQVKNPILTAHSLC